MTSIILILLILILGTTVVSIVSKGSYSPNHFYVKRRSALLYGYLGVLTTMSIVYFITMQSVDHVQGFEVSNEEELKADFGVAYKNGQLNDEAVKIIDEWTFKTDLEELKVKDIFSSIKIVVKNTGEPGKIKVTQFMMNIDHPVVDNIPSARVFFQEETGLLVIEENNEYVTVRGAYKEFPVRQMEGTSIMGDEYELDYNLYQQHIIVEVPKGVKAEVEY